MNETSSTKRMARGGLLVSLAFLFYYIGTTFSIIDIIKYISITPIIIGIVTYNFKHGIMIISATGLLIGILLGILSGAEFFLTSGIIGLTLGICLKRNLQTFNTVFYTFITALTGFTLNLLIYTYLMGVDITTDFKALAEGLLSAVNWLNSFEITRSLINSLTLLLGINENYLKTEWLIKILLNLLPSLLIFISFYYVIYIWLFNVFLIKRLKIELPSNAFLGEVPIFLLIPRWFLIFIPMGFILLWVNSYKNIGLLEIIGSNFLFIMCLLAFVKGAFTINTSLGKIIPQNKNYKIILSLTITLLEFTIFIPIVTLIGLLSIGFKSQNLLLYEYLGNTYFKNGKVEMAIKHYSKLLEYRPNNPWVHQMLGMAYQKINKPELAITHYKKAQELGGNITIQTYKTNSKRGKCKIPK